MLCLCGDGGLVVAVMTGEIHGSGIRLGEKRGYGG